jgi:hypothetical protein
MSLVRVFFVPKLALVVAVAAFATTGLGMLTV